MFLIPSADSFPLGCSVCFNFDRQIVVNSIALPRIPLVFLLDSSGDVNIFGWCNKSDLKIDFPGLKSPLALNAVGNDINIRHVESEALIESTSNSASLTSHTESTEITFEQVQRCA
jgi:hypothetical protein